MGTDKSFVPLLGKTLIEHVLDSVKGLGSENLIITNRPKGYAHLGLPMVTDIFRDHGPLGGMHAALHYAESPHVLIVACDMPWLNRSLLQHMISRREEADVIVPRWDRFPEPLHAVYSRQCLAHIENNLKEKKLKIVSFYSKVDVLFLDRAAIVTFDPSGRSFANINTPQDLSEAKDSL